MQFKNLSDDQLLAELGSLLGSEREFTAKLVACLGEIEQRRLHLLGGYSSMFDFCTKKLKLSEGEAFRRILAARLVRRFPLIESMIASGAVHLSALQLLAERLTEESHVELLEAASGKSKNEILELLAARFPKPDAPSKIRKLPQPHTAGASLEISVEPDSIGPQKPAARPRIEPLSPARYKVEFTARAELREKLERARDLMSHTNPSRELGVVIERATDLLLRDLEKKKFGKTERPRPAGSERKRKPGRPSTATRREVVGRDGPQCTYVSPDGRCCEARAFLEFDHIVPKGLRGGDHPENMRMRCRGHNQLGAEQVYGREQVEQCRHLRQEKSRSKPDQPAQSDRPVTDSASRRVFEKVRDALERMGFRKQQAAHLIAQVEKMHGPAAEPLPIAQVLREALALS